MESRPGTIAAWNHIAQEMLMFSVFRASSTINEFDTIDVTNIAEVTKTMETEEYLCKPGSDGSQFCRNGVGLEKESTSPDFGPRYPDYQKKFRCRHKYCQAKLIASTKGISPERLSKAKNCIYIQKYGVGVNNIEISEATKRGIPVGNTPRQNAASVAEHAVMLMLAVFRNLIVAHNSLVTIFPGGWVQLPVEIN